MLRLIHSQTVSGSILVSDIDDGLPNKTARRGVGDPSTYERDGYANNVKQPCYIPVNNAVNTALAGYIDLQETDRVVASAAKGVIKKLSNAGLITIVSFTPSDLAAVTETTATVAGSGILTIVGTHMLSTLPNVSSVILTGVAAVTLTRAQIITGGGTFTDTSIVIPAALVLNIGAQTLSAVKADGVTTAAQGLLVPAPVITTAVLSGGDVTITGTHFLSLTPNTTSVDITGTGAVVLTQAGILGGGGTISDTSIFLPAALVPGVALTTSSAQVTAQTVGSNIVVLT